MPGALAELLRDGPLTAGKLAFAWKTAVGPAVERVTAVACEGSIVRVETGSAEWAREITRSQQVILARLQTLLGERAVSGIEVRVAAGGASATVRRTR